VTAQGPADLRGDGSYNYRTIIETRLTYRVIIMVINFTQIPSGFMMAYMNALNVRASDVHVPDDI